MKKLLVLCAAWLCVPVIALAGIPIQFWTMENGAKVYLMEVQSLPMVDVQIEFDGGTRRDGKGLSGLAQATAMMMGKGVQARGDQPAWDENQ